MSVIVSRNGEKARRLERHVLENEEYLQQYVQANPDCIPLHELKAGIQLVVLAREFPTSSGNIDALAVDGDGEVYIIETKLYRNADKRRVIAQVLDYGAALASTSMEKSGFLDLLDQRATKAFGQTTIDVVKAEFELDETAALQFRDGIHEAVVCGKVTFVILMDRLDERLKNLIGFLNRNSLFVILGVELDFYRMEEIEILIPRLIGAEVRKEVVRVVDQPSKPTHWTEQSFLAAMQTSLAADLSQADAVQQLLDWSRQQPGAVVAWGAGKARGSFSVRFPVVSTSKSVITVYSDGTLSVNVGWLVESPRAEACARSLAADLRVLELADIPGNFTQRFPGIRPAEWTPRVAEVCDCLRRAVEAAASIEDGSDLLLPQPSIPAAAG